MKRLHGLISGRVQGVGYRNYAWQSARELSLKGYVRNLPDGNVEIVAEGKEEDLDKLVQALRRGPMLAKVKDISTQYGAAAGEFEEFEVRY